MTWSWWTATCLAMVAMTSCEGQQDDVTGWRGQEAGLQGLVRAAVRARRSPMMEKRLPRYGRSTRDYEVEVGMPDDVASKVRDIMLSRLANHDSIKQLQHSIAKFIQQQRDGLDDDVTNQGEVKPWYKRVSSPPRDELLNTKFFEEQRRMGPEFNPTGW